MFPFWKGKRIDAMNCLGGKMVWRRAGADVESAPVFREIMKRYL